MAVKHKVVEYVDRPVNNSCDFLSVILRCLEKFRDDPHSMPQGPALIQVCEAMVQGLGKLVVPREPSQIASFANDVRKIQEFLSQICSKDEYREQVIFAMLKTLYIQISNSEVKPGAAMSVILDLIDTNSIPNAINMILNAGHTDEKLQQALLTLCDWLVNWTKTPNLSACVLIFIQELENLKRFEILINVTLVTIEKFFSLLMLPAYRNGVGPIVIKMLSSMQGSPEAFHKIVPDVPMMIQRLKQENSETSLTYLQNIINLTMCLMEHFPGFDDLYQPLKIVLKLYPPSPSYRQYLNAVSWSNNAENFLITKSQNEKVGLNNLGNTCYMNSVLQALYMTRLFSNNILLNEHKWPLVLKLQSLFALLQYSPRNSLSPNEILNVARPSGFQRGHQHDSSEFLGHLLDVLHEQEKSILASRKEGDQIQSISTQTIPTQTSDNTVVQRSFGGRAETVYKCNNCETESIKADNFRDLQLSFPNDFIENDSVQKLLEYFFKPEILCGENQYFCEKCKGLSDANRIFRVIQYPARLILTLKHFRYDSVSQQRIKLLHRVKYDSIIKLGGLNYELYAVVVHCGSSVDSGHYYTYAKDGPIWFKFNDNFVSSSNFSELSNLIPPETPYILFYSRVDSIEPSPIKKSELPSFVQSLITRDRTEFESEKQKFNPKINFINTNKNFNNDDQPPPPPDCGGGGSLLPNDRYIC